MKTTENKSTSPAHDDFVELVRSATSQRLIDRNLTVDGCAKDVDVSRRSMQRFLTEAGQSFTQLVDQMRLDIATKLLADKNKSISEIASQLDYANAANFSRAFQRLSGVTPTQFRQNIGSRRSTC
ncbi:helix-turn-helix domain-containing protein [Planctomycetaceae bacterium SH139]